MHSLARRIVRPRPLLLAALALVAAPGLLHAASASGHNSDAPVNYEADRIELLEKQQRVTLTGNVIITQDDLRLRSARAVISYTNTGQMEIQRLDATGDVQVTRNNESARGDVAIYDFKKKLITLVGNVVMHRGNDVLRGQRAVMDLNTNLATVNPGSSAGGGRVSGTFTAPKHTDDK